MKSFGYQFDGNTESGLGVRTSAYQDAQTSYAVNTQDPFKRTTVATEKPGTGSTLSVGSTFDTYGNVTTRTVGTGTQTLTWDGEGRLVSVSQRDASNNGYDWSAVYDGLGRRLRTINQLIAGGSASGSPVTVDSYYDPQVEFQEIAVSVNGSRTWKVYGPDANGVYGGLRYEPGT